MATGTELITRKDVAETARKAYVRRYVHDAERQRTQRKVRDPLRKEIHDAIMESMSKEEWIFHWVREANLSWQKKQMWAWLSSQSILCYNDFKDFVRTMGWTENWEPRRLQSVWRVWVRRHCCTVMRRR